MAQKTHRGISTRASKRSSCLAAVTASINATMHPHDPPTYAGAEARLPAPTAGDRVRGSYRLLLQRGLSPIEAGNVVAYIAGLHAAESGWSVRQVEHLVALRSLVACGAIAV